MNEKSNTNHRTGEQHGDWTWCFRCERVHRTERWVAQQWLCPYCRADATDAFAWRIDTWPRKLNPDYPEEPLEGQAYPRYRGMRAH